MRCQDSRQKIYTYLDGELSASEERSFYAHLSQCPSCQEEMNLARQMDALLDECCSPVEPPLDFYRKVMTSLPGAEAGPEMVTTQTKPGPLVAQVKNNWRSYLSWQRWIPIAAGLVLLFTAGLLSWENTGLVVVERGETTQSVSHNHVLTNPDAGFQGPLDASQNDGPEVGAVLAGDSEDKKPETTVQNAEPVSEDVKNNDQEQAAPVERETPSVIKEQGDQTPQGQAQQAPGPEEAGTSGTVDDQPPVIPRDKPAASNPQGPVVIAEASSPANVILSQLAVEKSSNNIRGIWAPNGQDVWYLSQSGAPEGKYILWGVNPDGGQPQALMVGKNGLPVMHGGGVWSPQKDKIAYVENNNGYLEIWVTDLAGKSKSLTPVFPDQAANTEGLWAYNPVWSNSGEIAYLTTRSGSQDIMVVDGQGESRILAGTEAEETNPVWSPDGKKLAYTVTQVDAEGQQVSQVYVVNGDGTGAIAVTPPVATQVLVAAWSPDGEKLAVNAGGDLKHRGVFIATTDGSSRWQQVTTAGGGSVIKWSPDGQKLAFTDAAGVLHVLTGLDDARNRQLFQVTPQGGNGEKIYLDWSGDSQQLLLEKKSSSTGTIGVWLATLPKINNRY